MPTKPAAAKNVPVKPSRARRQPKVHVPQELSHFTTIEGLLGIINKREVWASNVSFLNDKQELLHGLAAIDKFIGLALEDSEYRDRSGILKSVLQAIRTSKLPETYAACFCKSSDLLSQWRGYSGRNQGVSITFDSPQLTDLADTFGARPMEVIYDEDLTQTRLAKSASLYLGEKTTLRKIFASGSDEVVAEMLRHSFTRLLPRLKDSGFSEEAEWRFVIQGKSNGTLEYRVKDGVIVPYVAIKAPEDTFLPIKKITVGPGRNQELTIRSVELFCKQKGYVDVQIVPSSVPYRE